MYVPPFVNLTISILYISSGYHDVSTIYWKQLGYGVGYEIKIACSNGLCWKYCTIYFHQPTTVASAKEMLGYEIVIPSSNGPSWKYCTIYSHQPTAAVKNQNKKPNKIIVIIIVYELLH